MTRFGRMEGLRLHKFLLLNLHFYLFLHLPTKLLTREQIFMNKVLFDSKCYVDVPFSCHDYTMYMLTQIAAPPYMHLHFTFPCLRLLCK